MSRRVMAACWPLAVLIPMFAAPRATCGELIYGCLSKPACGKVCKLVCEKKKITAVGYGYKCDAICVPGPSERGCKYCSVKCCGDATCDACKCGCHDAPAKIEFTWRKWLACGCAKPRSIKLLTKFQADKEICWYHWEVVDAGCCGCQESGCHEGCCAEADGQAPASDCPVVYKPAPADANVGDVLDLSEVERTELASAGAIREPSSIAAVAAVAESAAEVK